MQGTARREPGGVLSGDRRAAGADAADGRAGGRLRVRIEPSQHVFIAGQTGSGKSYLAEKLLSGVRVPAVILDPSWSEQFEAPGYALTYKLKDVERALKDGFRRVVFRPDGRDWGAVDDLFGAVYARGNTTLYNDERGGWGRGREQDLLPSEADLIMRGRKRLAALWTVSQRPFRVPIPLKSEADHFFLFRLQNPDDRQSLAAYAGKEIAEPLIPERWFWYKGRSDDRPRLNPPLGRLVTRRRGQRKA
jgi:DNA helicase HerA-like ATPase